MSKSQPESTQFITALLWAIAVAVVTQVSPVQAAAGSFNTSTPGQIFYTYTSPTVSVNAGVQIGNTVTNNVNQNSGVNISGTAQVGNTVKTTVTQTGQINGAFISQTGKNTSATVIQFGTGGSLLN